MADAQGKTFDGTEINLGNRLTEISQHVNWLHAKASNKMMRTTPEETGIIAEIKRLLDPITPGFVTKGLDEEAADQLPSVLAEKVADREAKFTPAPSAGDLLEARANEGDESITAEDVNRAKASDNVVAETIAESTE